MDDVWSPPEAFRFDLTPASPHPLALADAPGPLSGFGRNHPLCAGGCGHPARLNVHFFDPDENYSPSPRQAAAITAREAWQLAVSRRVAEGGAALVVLEVGCGTLVETLRHRIDCLVGDCRPAPPLGAAAALAAAAAASGGADAASGAAGRGVKVGGVTVVRITPSGELLPYEEARRGDDVHVRMGALEGLMRVDAAMRAAAGNAQPPGRPAPPPHEGSDEDFEKNGVESKRQRRLVAPQLP